MYLFLLVLFPMPDSKPRSTRLIYSLKLSLVRPDPPRLGQEPSETFGASWPNLILRLNTCSCLFWQRSAARPAPCETRLEHVKQER